MSDDTDKKNLASLGLALRRRRVALGLSQEQFAEKAGLHRTYVGSVERGERNVSFVNLVRVATALGLRASELLASTEELLNDTKPRTPTT
jgi:transcriptional regulator with XRE-family HTH domain